MANGILENNKPLINNNSELLAYLTQVVINRIIFIRICEARRIEQDGLLLKFKENGFWDNFKDSSYNDFYEHYDGPLFDRINSIHEIIVPDDIFNGLIELLYYPSPYHFDVIPIKLLSNIYEIFLSKKLYVENNVITEKLKLEYMKTNGAVSTPQFLVQDLIKRTIPKNKLLTNGLEGIFKTKILDFVCGSGIFLIEIFDYLQNIITEYYSQNQSDDYSELFFTVGNSTTLTIEGKRRIISNCIYAVDIDPEAVEVARMSLSLKVIDSIDFHENYQEIGIYGNQILYNVGNNVKCGNTLVSYDITEEYPNINTNEEQLFKTNPFYWNSESGFAEIFNKKDGFDYIVGNPPYVEVKNYNVEYPYMHQYIKGKYETTKNGKVDLGAFLKFNNISVVQNKLVQSCIEGNDTNKISDFVNLLKSKNGKYDFEDLTELFEITIPSKDVVTNGAVYTPNYIKSYIVDNAINSGDKKEIQHLTVADIACGTGAFLHSAVEMIKLKTAKSYTEIFRDNIYGLDISDYTIDRAKILLTLLAVSNGEDIPEFLFNLYPFSNVAYKLLNTNKGWILNKSQILENIEKLENAGIALGVKYSIKNGLATLCNDIFIFKPVYEDDKYYYLQNGKLHKIEKGICRDIIKPNRLKTENEIPDLKEKIIFPYQSDNNQLELFNGGQSKQRVFDEQYFEATHPNAYTYLKYNQEQLFNRDKGKPKKYKWFEFGRSQAINDYGKKLLFPYMSSQPYFVYTNQEDLLLYAGYAIFSDSERELQIVKRILESDVFWYYIKNTSKPYSGNYYALAKNYVKDFSICNLTVSEEEFILNTDSHLERNEFLLKKYDISNLI